MIRNIVCLIASIVCSFQVVAQNLVPNGGFEEENICIEYNKNCAPEAWIASSLWANYYFLQAGKGFEGTHFVGLTAGSLLKTGSRNFVRTRLLCGMRPGNQYELTFYVRSFNRVLDSVGVYFSEGDFLFEKRSYKEIQPQLWVTNSLDTLQQDPSIWQKVRFIYTARGDEGYITIGCFNHKDPVLKGRPDFQRDYFFFLDAVSLVPVDKQEKLCAGADSVKKEIYLESMRHEMLSRYVFTRRKYTQVINPLPKTTIKPPVIQKQRIDTLIIPDIFFATASYQLSPKSHGLLDSFSLKLRSYKVDSVVIEGHTDSVGKLEYNTALSQNRSNAVKEYIAAKVGEVKYPFTTRGFAYIKPVATNKTPAGRQKNRRVELYVYRKE